LDPAWDKMTTYMCLASNLQLTWFWHVERAQWSPNSRVRLHSSRGNSPILRSRLKRILIDVPAKINWSVKISAFDTWKEDSIRFTVWKIQKFTLTIIFRKNYGKSRYYHYQSLSWFDEKIHVRVNSLFFHTVINSSLHIYILIDVIFSGKLFLGGVMEKWGKLRIFLPLEFYVKSMGQCCQLLPILIAFYPFVKWQFVEMLQNRLKNSNQVHNNPTFCISPQNKRR